MIDIKCVCGEIYHADEKFIGKKIKCSKCGNIMNIELSNPQTSSQPVRDLTQPEKKGDKFTKTKQQHSFNTKIKALKDNKAVVYTLYFLFVVGILFLFSYIKDLNSVENQESRPTSGNIYNENIKTVEETNNQDSVDPYADWEKVDLRTGTTPDCFNFTPTYDFAIKNKLSVKVGSNTDVVLKLCSNTTNKCIRYVYIRSGETYKIKNIPQDKYYTKIAYGTDWRQKIDNGQCVGKFTHNALYKKGEEIMDFHKQINRNHIQVPYFSLFLDVSVNDSTQKYETNSISEEEFNK
jgi:hypothetical protein